MTAHTADNPFAVLGLPESFDLTAEQVMAAHMKVAAQLHPDRAGDPLQRDELMRKSAVAGSAKQQLMNDIGRAEALLKVREARAERGDNAAAHAAPTGSAPAAGALPPEFLAESLELRERIEEAAGDAAAIRALGQEVAASRKDCARELSELLNRTPHEMSAARSALARLRYYERMRVRLQELQ